MILTRQSKVPWSWVWISQLPFMFWMLTTNLQGSAFTFSLRKFTDNPALISLVFTAVNIPLLIIAPLINYSSDRIWTRFGRRKPFYVVSNVLGAACLALFPLAPNFWVLTALLVGFWLTLAMGKTFFPLSQEVIPVPQRGRGSAIHTLMFQVAILLYWTFLIGRFDSIFTTGPIAAFASLNGEKFIYWFSALLMLMPALLIALSIKELPIPGMRTDFSLRKFFGGFLRDVFDKRWAVLYLLTLANAIFGLGGLGVLQGLLYTDQWNYSKQDMGLNVAIGTVILLPFIVLAGWLSDRFDKLKIYFICSLFTVLTQVAYWLFVMFMLPDHRPALWQIILFGEFGAIFGLFASTVSWPLIYEFIPTKSMGTASAGLEMAGSFFGILFTPLMGFWVAGYSSVFTPPSSHTARIVLAAPATRSEIAARLDHGRLKYFVESIPKFAPADQPGRQWTICQADEKTAQAVKEMEALRVKIGANALRPDSGELATLRARLAELEKQSSDAGAAFTTDVKEQLLPILAAEEKGSGEWLTGSRILIKTDSPARAAHLAGLTALNPDILASVTQDHQLSAFLSDASQVPQLEDSLEKLREKKSAEIAALGTLTRWQKLFHRETSNASESLADLSLILSAENPLTEVSGVTVYSAFHPTVELPTPKALKSLQAVLSSSGDDPVKITQAPGGFRSLSYFPNGAPADRAQAGDAAQSRIAAAAKSAGIVLPQPVADSGFRPKKYDYFSAYLFAAAMGAIGLGITLYIMRLVRRGVIRRLAVEEEQALEQLDESAAADVTGSTRTYTPGYRRTKLAMVVFGLLVAGLGGWQLAAPLFSVFAGKLEFAEISAITRHQAGFADQPVLAGQSIAEDQTRSASYLYAVRPLHEREKSVALATGAMIKPGYEIGDRLLIAFPDENALKVYAIKDLSTWIPGAALLVVGLLFSSIFLVVLRNANRPLTLPADTPEGFRF